MQEKGNRLWGLVLVSTTIKELSAEQIEKDLPGRCELRIANRISGISVYAGGNVLMQLEGDRPDVYEQYEQIRKYHGHHSIIKLYDGEQPYRFFESYPMAFKVMHPEKLKRLETFKSEEEKEYFDEFLSTDHIVPKIIADFMKNNM